jgi:SAM-dependent methyltransferase
VTARDRWLAALWPHVRSHLPAPPAVVVEIGCGSHGGFVPRLADTGYQPLGIDPEAPEGPLFRRGAFERSDLPDPVDAMVACTSLHHVADPAEVVDKIASGLIPGGAVIVIEWDWHRFDEATAQWCFARLGPPEPHHWLRGRHDDWIASGQSWTSYLHAWAAEHGLHAWERLLSELDGRFDRVACAAGPYFFADLAGTSEADEMDAIDAGRIRATRVDYVGRAPGLAPR